MRVQKRKKLTKLRELIKTHKVHTIIIAAIAINLIGVGGAAAYMTSVDTAANDFTVGHAKIEITEKYDPQPELHPGTVISKDVKFTNTGDCSCYMRARVLFTDGDMEKSCTVDYNTADFIYLDGYYYHKEPLAIGEMTESLFTTVTVNKNVAQDDIKDFDVLVYAEVYQAEGFDDHTAAWNYFERNHPNM